MFGISEIKKRLDNLEYENKELKFRLDNPPKYKVGDRVGKAIVTKVEIEPEYNLRFISFFPSKEISGFRYKYFGIAFNEKEKLIS